MQIINSSEKHELIQIKSPEYLVVISTSTGGPQALAQLLPRFPANFPGTIIVVQHMRQGFTRFLANQLNHICQLPVHEPTDGQTIQSSRILITPGGSSLSIQPLEASGDAAQLIFLESIAHSVELQRKCADNIMASAVASYGKMTIGVLLTGAGMDGAEGLRTISQAGGYTIVQDEQTSVVHDLPASAIQAGVAHEILPLWSIGDRIIELVTGEINAIAA
ncbi:MAG: CheB methylesterase domain-containing protein [Armatimonadetes bacterium]|nr:CheB methylesterase domain-containing protein [Armatimonadota bacterium]